MGRKMEFWELGARLKYGVGVSRQGSSLDVHKSLISVYEGYFGVNISLI
jgi:hypothetical protein